MGIFPDLVVFGSYPTSVAYCPVCEITFAYFPSIHESAPPSVIAKILSECMVYSRCARISMMSSDESSDGSLHWQVLTAYVDVTCIISSSVLSLASSSKPKLATDETKG